MGPLPPSGAAGLVPGRGGCDGRVGTAAVAGVLGRAAGDGAGGEAVGTGRALKKGAKPSQNPSFGASALMESRVCQQCGATFEKSAAYLRYNERRGTPRGIYCSRACANPAARLLKGTKRPGKYETRTCEACGGSFDFLLSRLNSTTRDRSNEGRFCSKECFDNTRRVEINCAACGSAFKVYRAHAHRKYCSTACAGVAPVEWLTIPCDMCGKDVKMLPSHRRRRKSVCCSRDCTAALQAERRKAAGFTMKSRLGRREWQRVRESVLDRDGRRCVLCSKAGVRLNVHHVVRWRLTQDDSEGNLVTLCAVCHSLEYSDEEGLQRRLAARYEASVAGGSGQT